MGKLLRWTSILIIMVVLIGAYGVMIEPNLLRVNHMEIGSGAYNLRVVHFTDTHLDNNYNIKDLQKLVRIINLQDPDIVVFTGDFIDSVDDHQYPEDAIVVLKEIKANLGKYAVYGNHDYGAKGYKYYSNMMQKSGFQLLVNDSRILLYEGQKIRISGLDDALLGSPDYEKVAGFFREDVYDILLLHEPDQADYFLPFSVELVLGGHSHGGQIRLPFIGAVTTPPLSEKYIKGLYKIGPTQNIYVSSGVGTTSIPARILNPPEIAVFDIKIG